MTTVRVTVNGAGADLPADETVAGLVDRLAAGRVGGGTGGGHGRVAVARNGDVVPRSVWGTTRLSAGDVLEVLAPTAGG